MRVVIQRVSKASVTVEGKITSEIGKGLLVLAGFEDADSDEDVTWISNKIIQIRIFADNEGIMNKNVGEVGGEVLLVSQFTLHASTKKGNRPSYSKASKSEVAIRLYEALICHLNSGMGKNIKTGIFGADMQVALVNDGPVTIVIDSKNKE